MTSASSWKEVVRAELWGRGELRITLAHISVDKGRVQGVGLGAGGRVQV